MDAILHTLQNAGYDAPTGLSGEALVAGVAWLCRPDVINGGAARMVTSLEAAARRAKAGDPNVAEALREFIDEADTFRGDVTVIADARSRDDVGDTLTTVHKSNCRDASPPRLNHDLHAIDATPARWRAPGGLSPLHSVSAVAFSPWKDLVKNYRVRPTHWLIYAQVANAGTIADKYEGFEELLYKRLERQYESVPGGPFKVWRKGPPFPAPEADATEEDVVDLDAEEGGHDEM